MPPWAMGTGAAFMAVLSARPCAYPEAISLTRESSNGGDFVKDAACDSSGDEFNIPIGGPPIGGAPIGGAPIGGPPIGGAPIGGPPIGGPPICKGPPIG